jgi:hypothetical protein
MTDPNPARPSDRNVARFRQFKQARESRIPRCADGDAVASHAWPRYFKVSTTDAVSIADTHLVIRKSLDGGFLRTGRKQKLCGPENAPSDGKNPSGRRMRHAAPRRDRRDRLVHHHRCRVCAPFAVHQLEISRLTFGPSCRSMSGRVEGRHLLKAIGACIPRRSRRSVTPVTCRRSSDRD